MLTPLRVKELLSLEIEDRRTDYSGNMDALAVEDVSVHDWPPLRWPPPWAPRQVALTARSVIRSRGSLDRKPLPGFLIRDWMAPIERFSF
jgi:hypothetical protein